MNFTDTELENLNAIQNIEIEMLNEFDRICKKHNLTYSVAGGTLLGTIRHSDFIPWDDDIDIDLKRKDFNKLISILPEELPPEYEFINYNEFGECFCDFIPRIFYNNCNVKNSFNSDDCSKNLVNDERINGIFIELYCLHDTKNSRVNLQILQTKIIYGLAMGHRYFKFDKSKYSFVERIAVSVLSSIGKLIKLKTIFKLYESNCNKVSSENSDVYFKPSVPLPVQKKNIFKKDWFASFDYHKMRNTSVSIPSKYDDVLKSLYGNWKSLPPESEQKPSHYDLKEVEIY